jgi:hypothetical protein
MSFAEGSVMAETKRQMADDLWQTATRGPVLRNEQTRRLYRLWSTTWLLPKLVKLVPELKDRRLPVITSEPDDFWDDYFHDKPGV